MRNEILQLRKDPAANAAMAGVLTRSNSFKLTGALGRGRATVNSTSRIFSVRAAPRA